MDRVYVAAVGEQGRTAATQLVEELSEHGVVVLHMLSEGVPLLRQQLRQWRASQCPLLLVMSDREAESGVVVFGLLAGSLWEVPRADVLEAVRQLEIG